MSDDHDLIPTLVFADTFEIQSRRWMSNISLEKITQAEVARTGILKTHFYLGGLFALVPVEEMLDDFMKSPQAEKLIVPGDDKASVANLHDASNRAIRELTSKAWKDYFIPEIKRAFPPREDYYGGVKLDTIEGIFQSGIATALKMRDRVLVNEKQNIEAWNAVRAKLRAEIEQELKKKKSKSASHGSG